ncbi:MAG TPA: sarcosine oxidase subunit gamma family protein [Steroidobacteraceae bacterium]|jgi:sarcosine oxidase subunit gamma
MPELSFAGPGVRTLPPAARLVLRGALAVRTAAARALNISIPEQACRALDHAGGAALWLGPDERLLLLPRAEGLTAADTLESALRGLPHAVVDVSQRQIALAVSGAQAPALLNAGCPLNLDLQLFPAGACTRTVFAKAEIVLWRRRSDEFHLEVWRSFAAYVAGYLSEAARDLPGAA